MKADASVEKAKPEAEEQPRPEQVSPRVWKAVARQVTRLSVQYAKARASRKT